MPPTAKINPKKPDNSTPFAYRLPNRRMLLVNGPNLNLLGKREPDIYGTTTLADIEHHLKDMLRDQHIELICIQSNSENELIDAIQYHGLLADTPIQVDAIIINPAAFTHTSVAIRDALLATGKPFIEVHLSNIHNREGFRRQSFFSDCAVGVICGLGHQGYEMAVRYFIAQYTDI